MFGLLGQEEQARTVQLCYRSENTNTHGTEDKTHFALADDNLDCEVYTCSQRSLCKGSGIQSKPHGKNDPEVDPYVCDCADSAVREVHTKMLVYISEIELLFEELCSAEEFSFECKRVKGCRKSVDLEVKAPATQDFMNKQVAYPTVSSIAGLE